MKPESFSCTLAFSLLVAALASACSEETCGDCRDEKCSDLVAQCSKDAACDCMAACLGDHGIPGVEACLASCDLSERPAAFIPVEECVAIGCPDEDECSTPSDYAPPEMPASDDTSALEAHGGGGGLADCSFDDGLSCTPDECEVLQLESANRKVCVRLRRVSEGAGEMANTQWKLLEIHVGPVGGVALVDDPADLCWYSSHHNFLDWAHAWTGSVRYDIKLREMMHGGDWSFALYPYEHGPVDGGSCAAGTDGTEPIGEPIALVPYQP